ncbi:MAG: 50S ribosomal protein L6, partial [Paludibacteraceae bacterium]|nr:50S ribosomal protein L6 [Paludibacteraceae bacterium]
MSRIGKLPIDMPKGVTVTMNGQELTVKGPKGELKQTINPAITVEVKDGQVHVSRPNDEKENRAMHGLYRALIHNMIVGVSEGYKKTLELVGVGYRASNNGQVLELSLGYTHNIFVK